jgi:cysteine desulfurase
MRVYLDHAASTPLRPAVLDAMLPWLTTEPGNPSGAHRAARAARRAIDDARDAVAALAGARPGEVVFTSGGTEADNLAIFGTVGCGPPRGPLPSGEPAAGPVVLASAVEHHAVLESVEQLGGHLVGVDRWGRIALDELGERLGAAPAPSARGPAGPPAGQVGGIVSVQLVNNEVGTVQPLHEVVELVRSRRPDVRLHTDAVQAGTWLDVGRAAAGVDLISLSAHKLGGPKGVGALVARTGVGLRPQLVGGGQERGLRSGTHNVAGIVGFGVAADEVVAARAATVDRVAGLRRRLLDRLHAVAPAGWRLTVPANDGFGDGAPRLAERSLPEGTVVAGIVNICFPNLESEALLFLLDEAGLCASAGASCASGAVSLSHVLAAMGVDPDQARGALRLSLGWNTTPEEVDAAVGIIGAALTKLSATARP